MTTHPTKILFLHGLDSSRDSTEFHAIESKSKFCINVDYRNLSFQTVADFYHAMIDQIKPNLLIGHSLGAYWALKMSYSHKIPAIVANPQLTPYFRTDYHCIETSELEHDIPQLAYIELGDEVLDMHATTQFLEQFMQVEVYAGGHHRLAQPENLNALVIYMQAHFLRA